ncbi:hypothetical protein POSPLADRAFT_1157299 [Postia placenta MAD-698-R-SB12]|uniref:Arrestin-like N-terminal domain-containing protein n=1 Tax=Postia placenta MAD-698-R-SB12 TaxID=670580 RepID=A0A1X6MLE1_9APHY|nr:hypothetical protein POSPLADRAFT_1157299 [Postia placenta MAD-698-R-SB12]OSX57251.1 hypothetical protein POSPLADRAFT_1157299 [Postia placenta MAD-698-R-SB12]
MHNLVPITLWIEKRICVSGGIVEGIVKLNFVRLQEEHVDEVRVELKGSANTYVGLGSPQEHHGLVDLKLSVWTRGSAFPPPGSHFLILPFQFELPYGLPPSIVQAVIGGKADIVYKVEAIGVRSAVLHSNLRTSLHIAVVPPDPNGIQLRSNLEAGWNGHWTTATEHKKMRRDFWGAYAEVKMEFVRPMLPGIPLFTKIPFIVSITTWSKPTKHDDEHTWPVLPTEPRQVRFELRQRVAISAQARQNPPGTETSEREWIPTTTDPTVGCWKQEVAFGSVFKLKCTPSFNEMNFGGMFNTISMDIPITVLSGMVAHQLGSAPHVPEPAELDLPP